MHQFSARGCPGIAIALAMAGLMFSSQASSTEVPVLASDPPLPALTEPGQVLAPAVYRARREALMKAMGEGVAVVFGQGVEDGDGYRPNSDFFYLTGVLEENAILVLAPRERTYREFLLLPSRDPEAERWTGERESIGAELRAKYGFEKIHRTGRLTNADARTRRSLTGALAGCAARYRVFQREPQRPGAVPQDRREAARSFDPLPRLDSRQHAFATQRR